MYNERPPFDTAGYGLRRGASRAAPSRLVSSAASSDPTTTHSEKVSATAPTGTPSFDQDALDAVVHSGARVPERVSSLAALIHLRNASVGVASYASPASYVTRYEPYAALVRGGT